MTRFLILTDILDRSRAQYDYYRTGLGDFCEELKAALANYMARPSNYGASTRETAALKALVLNETLCAALFGCDVETDPAPFSLVWSETTLSILGALEAGRGIDEIEIDYALSQIGEITAENLIPIGVGVAKIIKEETEKDEEYYPSEDSLLYFAGCLCHAAGVFPVTIGDVLDADRFESILLTEFKNYGDGERCL